MFKQLAWPDLFLLNMAKKKKKVVKLDQTEARRQFLALKPARNPSLSWEEVEERVVLTIPRPDNVKVKLINIFFPVPEDRKVVLDPLGTHVWRQCDGLTTISKIAASLQSEYKLGAKEAELSLRQFFQDLGKRGYIGFATEKKRPAATSEDIPAESDKSVEAE